MNETPASLGLRGRAYLPPLWLLELGMALGAHEPCPVLFRFPGVTGLRELFEDGAIAFVGPAHLPQVALSRFALHDDVRGAAWFGTLALTRPLDLSPVKAARDGFFAGVNLPLAATRWAWVPPSALEQAQQGGTPGAVERALEACDLARETGRVAARVRDCFHEIRALNERGCPRPRKPWVELSPRERLEILERFGVEPRFTRETLETQSAPGLSAEAAAPL